MVVLRSDTHVGARVREARTAAGLSLRELARRLELSPATISALEQGKTALSIDRLHAIADALGVPPVQLFANSTTAPPMLEQPIARDAWRSFGELELSPVLRAALTCIMRKGYHGCSIREIAEEANLSVAALYHHYPSKQAMLVALFELTMTEVLWRATAARDEADPAAPDQRLSRLVESLTLYHSYRSEVAFVGASEMRSLEGDNRATIATKRVALQRLVDLEVEAGVELGIFATDRPRDAARAVVTMCVSVAQWFRPSGGETPEDIAANYVRFALGVVAHRG